MSKIGIVILNYMTWSATNKCIRSIQNNVNYENIQIYVVDNASPNKEAKTMLVTDKQIKLIENDTNSGYAAGNNVGVSYALEDGCDYVLISNNDIAFEENAILKMQQYLESHHEYDIVAPSILSPDGIVQKCHFKKQVFYSDIWKTQTVFRYICQRGIDQVYGDFEFYQREQKLFAAAGCCFMMTAKCAEKVTPFDEKTFLYEEENILGVQMERLGMKTGYYPESRVIHYHDQTTRLVKPFALICWACSEIYYLSQYLSVSRCKILLLYWYRVLIFLLHGIRNAEYRKQWKDFKEKTGKYRNNYC